MILEIAQIEVKAGMEAAFEEGVTKAAPIFQRARGCKGMELQRSLEQPARYRLFVALAGRSRTTPSTSAARPTSRNGASSSGHCFERPPDVEHTTLAVHGFGRICG
jgi:heme-degrading monooxygenase HmoA